MPQVVQRDIEISSMPDVSMACLLGLELKSPLVALKLAAEQSGNALALTQAERALKTIDSVLLHQRLVSGQQSLDLEPVHVGSVMTTVLDDMRVFLDELGFEADVQMQHGINTVDADKETLRMAMECMLQAMVAAAHRPSPMIWQVFRSGGDVRISVTNNSVDVHSLSTPTNEQMISSSMPIQGLASSATHLVTAQGLFAALGGTMRKVRRQGGVLQGFGVTLQSSQQMTLV